MSEVESKHGADALEEWLSAKVAQTVGAPATEIDVEAAFSDLGLSSRDAILLTADIEDHLGTGELEPSLMWDFPTIRALAAHLATM